MVLIIILAVALCVGLYFLWANGYMVTQAKRALKYIESMKGRRASFSSCTGFTRRVVRFSESRAYHFDFSAELSKGEVSAELLDSAKRPLLSLTVDSPSACIDLNRESRYYLLFRFQSATGEYSLSWN